LELLGSLVAESFDFVLAESGFDAESAVSFFAAGASSELAVPFAGVRLSLIYQPEPLKTTPTF
jgi:hypothetical protein